MIEVSRSALATEGASSIHVGIKIPNWGPIAGPEALRRTSAAAEARGFGSVWVSDHIAMPARLGSDFPHTGTATAPFDPSTPFLDPFASLTYVASVTRHVQLGTGVLVLPLRHPIATAKQAASVDVLSGGRLLLGVGVGWLAEEFDLLGQGWRDRGRRTDEGIGIMRATWAPGATALPGPLGRFGPVEMNPRPAAVPGVPVFVGGHSERALRRAVRLGDGWYASGMAVDEFAASVGWLRAATSAEHPGQRLLAGVRPGYVAPGDAHAVVESFRAAGADFVVLDGQGSAQGVDQAVEWVHRTADALSLDGTRRPLVSLRRWTGSLAES